MEWATFWFLILYGPLLLGAELCLIVSFSSFSLPFCSFLQFCYYFLSFHSAISIMMLFDPSLLGLFGSVAYSSLNDSIWSFGLRITLLVGSFVPFISFWASLTHLLSLDFLGPFPNFTFLLAFTNSFELSWPNYLIFHPWGSWACHQPLIFFACITSGLLWPILTFLYHILSMGLLLLFLSLDSFRPLCFLKAFLFISWACNPLFLPLGLNDFSLHLLTLFCPCCWASSFYWAS